MKKILNYTIIDIGGYDIQLILILKFIGFILLIITGLYLLKKAINKTHKIDEAKKYAVYNLLKYVIFVYAAVIGLQILGFNLSILLAGSAALLVGVGLGLQNLFSDFVSGIIILIDSSIKVNDVIEVNGIVSRVQEINLRTTTVLTRDDKYIILPNSDLTKNQLINWTHGNIASRFAVNVGVGYDSDADQVMQILQELILAHEGVQKEPKPFIRFEDFADSTINFSVNFWVEDVFRVLSIESSLRIKIFKAFGENNIDIALPQRVLHLKNPELWKQQ